MINGDQDYLQMAYDQCRLYREAMLDPDVYLWQHVVLGPWQDYGLWATGNAWAAAGMMRVHATMRQSKFSSSFGEQMGDLGNWAAQITQQSWRYRNLTAGGLANYLGPNDTSTFMDTASTALMAATTYRLSQFGIDNSMIPYAEAGRAVVQSMIDSSGWLAGAVDPITWTEITRRSPEGQAFVLMMEAAWRDWQAASRTKISRKRKRSLAPWR